MIFKPLFVFFIAAALPQQTQTIQKSLKFPYPEQLNYHIEWRLITAGTATVRLSRPLPTAWQLDLHLESAGMVTRLYKVLDAYKMVSNEQFCASSVVLDAQEGKRRHLTQLTFQNTHHKLEYDERDLLGNRSVKRVIDIAPCTHDVAGGLAALRTLNLEPSKSAMLPITDGKKMVNARVEAQSRENITVSGKTYHAIRYEVFLFDNVLYKRRGRLLIWMTDDGDHLPVQFRFQLGFPIGTISLYLDNQQKM